MNFRPVGVNVYDHAPAYRVPRPGAWISAELVQELRYVCGNASEPSHDFRPRTAEAASSSDGACKLEAIWLRETLILREPPGARSRPRGA